MTHFYRREPTNATGPATRQRPPRQRLSSYGVVGSDRTCRQTRKPSNRPMLSPNPVVGGASCSCRITRRSGKARLRLPKARLVLMNTSNRATIRVRLDEWCATRTYGSWYPRNRRVLSVRQDLLHALVRSPAPITNTPAARAGTGLIGKTTRQHDGNVPSIATSPGVSACR